MATKAPTQSSNRQNGTGRNGLNSSSMDVGLSAVTQMARDDTRWFVVGVVILSLVLFLAMPITALMMIEEWKLRAEVRQEVRRLQRMEKQLDEKAHSAHATASDGL